ncbi:MAG: flagellar basal body-associated FliL family protein [Pseudomonadota bacterium]
MAEEQVPQEGNLPTNKSNVPVLIAVVGLLVIGGGTAFYFVAGSGSKGAGGIGISATMGPTVAVPSLIVNLNEPGGTRYLKLSIELEIFQPLLPEQEKLQLRLRDKLIVYLSDMKASEVLAAKAKLEIKKTVQQVANEVYGPGTIREVYLKEFVLQ